MSLVAVTERCQTDSSGCRTLRFAAEPRQRGGQRPPPLRLSPQAGRWAAVPDPLLLETR